jgi:tetrahydromethanopterin S-methyltransferase subunit G
MSALAFNTHAFVKRLTTAGMPEAQAEVLADQQAKLIDEKLATKTDLAAVERSLKYEIDTKVESVKSELVKWMFGTIGFHTIIIPGAVIALAPTGRP